MVNININCILCFEKIASASLKLDDEFETTERKDDLKF